METDIFQKYLEKSGYSSEDDLCFLAQKGFTVRPEQLVIEGQIVCIDEDGRCQFKEIGPDGDALGVVEAETYRIFRRKKDAIEWKKKEMENEINNALLQINSMEDFFFFLRRKKDLNKNFSFYTALCNAVDEKLKKNY